MKKLLILSLLLLLFFGVKTHSNLSVAYPISDGRGHISTSAENVDEIDPNRATIVFTVEATSKELPSTTESLNELSAKLTEALKTKLKDKDTIKTSAYNVSPVYYDKDKKRVLLGYKAVTKMKVTTNNLKELPNIISVGLNHGAVAVSDLHFSLSNYNEKCSELSIGATKKAYANATAVAKALNTTLDGVNYIDSSCSTDDNRVMYFRKTQVAGANEADSVKNTLPSIEPGTIIIRSRVNASFFVK